MNLREAVDNLQSLRLEELEMSCGQLRADIRQAVSVREAYLKMAEAALAYVEWQIDNGGDVPMDGATYMREREKLWDAFMAARDKTKEVNHEST